MSFLWCMWNTTPLPSSPLGSIGFVCSISFHFLARFRCEMDFEMVRVEFSVSLRHSSPCLSLTLQSLWVEISTLAYELNSSCCPERSVVYCTHIIQTKLLLLLALQPSRVLAFSLIFFLSVLSFTQFSPPSYSHRLDIFFVFSPSFPWSSSDSPTHWLPF